MLVINYDDDDDGDGDDDDDDDSKFLMHVMWKFLKSRKFRNTPDF